jgi:AcrR family transcriptional regulator
MRTKERIKQKALDLFNREGIEYVGMRELAASLDMQIGNITYYFPTKDDLVNQLALDLSALNSNLQDQSGDLTLLSFLTIQEKVFFNQWEYRCLFLSFVHIIKQNPVIRKRYAGVGNERAAAMIANLKKLEKLKYLQVASATRLQSLASAASLIARFWISDAALAYHSLSVPVRIRHYSNLIAEILRPYATKTGIRQIEEFMGS